VLGVSSVTTVPGVVSAVLLYAVGVATATAAASAYITDLTRRARYGSARGVFGTTYDVGDALCPMVAGFLVAAVGYARMFQVMAAVALAMAVAFVVAWRVSGTSPVGWEP
jgi:MFS family permease